MIIFYYIVIAAIYSINFKTKNKMKNLLLTLCVFSLISCGTSTEECTHDDVNTTDSLVVEETTLEVVDSRPDTLDVSGMNSVQDLLDTLGAMPSQPVVE